MSDFTAGKVLGKQIIMNLNQYVKDPIPEKALVSVDRNAAMIDSQDDSWRVAIESFRLSLSNSLYYTKLYKDQHYIRIINYSDGSKFGNTGADIHPGIPWLMITNESVDLNVRNMSEINVRESNDTGEIAFMHDLTELEMVYMFPTNYYKQAATEATVEGDLYLCAGTTAWNVDIVSVDDDPTQVDYEGGYRLFTWSEFYTPGNPQKQSMPALHNGFSGWFLGGTKPGLNDPWPDWTQNMQFHVGAHARFSMWFDATMTGESADVTIDRMKQWVIDETVHDRRISNGNDTISILVGHNDELLFDPSNGSQDPEVELVSCAYVGSNAMFHSAQISSSQQYVIYFDVIVADLPMEHTGHHIPNQVGHYMHSPCRLFWKDKINGEFGGASRGSFQSSTETPAPGTPIKTVVFPNTLFFNREYILEPPDDDYICNTPNDFLRIFNMIPGDFDDDGSFFKDDPRHGTGSGQSKDPPQSVLHPEPLSSFFRVSVTPGGRFMLECQHDPFIGHVDIIISDPLMKFLNFTTKLEEDFGIHSITIVPTQYWHENVGDHDLGSNVKQVSRQFNYDHPFIFSGGSAHWKCTYFPKNAKLISSSPSVERMAFFKSLRLTSLDLNFQQEETKTLVRSRVLASFHLGVDYSGSCDAQQGYKVVSANTTTHGDCLYESNGNRLWKPLSGALSLNKFGIEARLVTRDNDDRHPIILNQHGIFDIKLCFAQFF